MTAVSGRLHIVPTFRDEAAAFIARHHRHHGPPQGYLFAVGVADEHGQLVGVAIVGRPVARVLQDGWTCEVTRTCTDGTRNANSALYGAAWRAARALGYRRCVTYTQPDEETGASLRAAGWRRVADLPPRGDDWDTPGRRRAPSAAPVGVSRARWEVESAPAPWASRPVPPRPDGDTLPALWDTA